MVLSQEKEAIAGWGLGVVRYIGLELEATRPLGGIKPPLRGVQALAMPDERHVVLCDRPEGSISRLTCIGPHATGEIELDAPGFLPHLLADTDWGCVLAVGEGENSGLLFDMNGHVIRRYNLGEDIADIALDPDGNIVVLRAHAPLLDRYGSMGDLVVNDPVLGRVMEATSEGEGNLLLVQRDGTLWLNLTEKYDNTGALISMGDPAEVFGPGPVAADILGWDGVLILNEEGRMGSETTAGTHRTVHLPKSEIQVALGRGLTAASDLFVTRDERLWLLATDQMKLMQFRILSE